MRTDTSTPSYGPSPALAAEPPALTDLWGAEGVSYRVVVHPLGGAAKRAFDIIVSVLAVTALAPLLFLIGLLVRLESPGQALFKQRRAGFRGRLFRIYKFRTMRAAEDGRDVVQAQAGDVRVTRLGAILRRTSIDELPQLLNVLKGEMSLVGPRPHAIVHEHSFRRYDSAYLLRRSARPGITGLAQVSGARGLTDTDDKVAQRIEYDVAYIRDWSLWLDIKILFRTLSVLLGDSKAL